MQTKLKHLTLLALFVVGAVALFRYPEAVATGASRGLTLCGNILIPAFLPFLALAGTFMRSSLCSATGRLLTPLTKTLFRLPGVCAPVILFSMIGGYPAGATALEPLLAEGQISEQQAGRMLRFCVNSGPAFAVCAVGAGMLGDTRLGWVLLASHLFGSILIGFFESRFVPKTVIMPPPSTAPAPPFAVCFTQGVNGGILSLLYMCGFVILFCIGLSVADGSGISLLFERLSRLISPTAPSLLPGLLEVTAGCMEIAGSRPLSMFFLGFCMGFGGLSVHCQVRAVLSAYPSVFRGFFLFRVLHGALGGIFATILCHFVPLSVSTVTPGTVRLSLYTASPSASLALLGMAVVYLWAMQKKIAKCR